MTSNRSGPQSDSAIFLQWGRSYPIMGVQATAASLGRAPCTVSRELRRNTLRHDRGVYDGDLGACPRSAESSAATTIASNHRSGPAASRAIRASAANTPRRIHPSRRVRIVVPEQVLSTRFPLRRGVAAPASRLAPHHPMGNSARLIFARNGAVGRRAQRESGALGSGGVLCSGIRPAASKVTVTASPTLGALLAFGCSATMIWSTVSSRTW